MSFVQECTPEDVEEATYTSRQLNSLSTGIQGYNFITLCTMVQQQSVVQALKKCYERVDTAYCYEKSQIESKLIVINPLAALHFSFKQVLQREWD